MVLVALTVNVDLAVPLTGRLTPAGFNDAGSFDPVKNSDNDTVPEKPLTLITLTVEVRDAPCSIDKVEGFTVRRNNGPALLPSTNELTTEPHATVPTAATTITDLPLGCTRLMSF